jgi:hypothetical protein
METDGADILNHPTILWLLSTCIEAMARQT